jgi:cell division protein FtsW
VTGLLPVTGIPLPLISAGGTSLLITFFVFGVLVSFARHEAPAVTAARKAHRLGRRSRLERWCRIPVPRAYVPPKRRAAPPRVNRDTGRAPGRPAAPREHARVVPVQRLRPTGTEGRRR